MLVRTGSPYHPLPSQLNLQFSTFSPVRFHAVMISLSRHQVLFAQNRMCNRFPKLSAVQTTSKQLVNDLRCASSCSSESKVLDERESRCYFFSESAMVYPRKLPGPRRALAKAALLTGNAISRLLLCVTILDSGLQNSPSRKRLPNMKKIVFWIPAVFCALLSLIALSESIGFRVFFGKYAFEGWWQPVFFSFLPMCFFSVGAGTTYLHRELNDLRRRVAELEQRAPR